MLNMYNGNLVIECVCLFLKKKKNYWVVFKESHRDVTNIFDVYKLLFAMLLVICKFTSL